MSDNEGGQATVEADGPQPHILHRWMFAAAIILSLATLLSAWTGYEASRWGSTYSSASRAATVARLDAVTASDSANRQLTTDILLFSDWFHAEVEGNAPVADKIRAHFRSEFVPAFETWLATAPGGELPAGTPFDGGYRLAAEAEAGRLRSDAADTSLAADRASQTSDDYVLAAVLYASVLFLAGISSKISGRKAQRLTVVLSGVAFVVALFFTFSLPIML